MSTLFDVPAHLAVVLALAASAAGDAGTPSSREVAVVQPTRSVLIAEEPAGPLHFGERAWLRALQEHPDVAESGGVGGRVFVTSGGRYYIPRPDDREPLLAARHKRAFAASVAKAVAERNALRIRHGLGRQPSAGDLYVAHVFGVEAAISLIGALHDSPQVPVVEVFPELAKSVAEIDGGTSFTVREFYGRLVAAVGEPPRLVALGMQPTPVPGADPPPWTVMVSTVAGTATTASRRAQ